MDRRRFGSQVVYFSDTTGGGWAGLALRLRLAGDKGPVRLAADVRRKWHRRFRPHEPLPFAQAIHLEVTNACNLRCVMCPRQFMDRPVGRMDRERFGEIARQLKTQRDWIESVALMGLGEPFLHPELLDLGRIAKEAGLHRLYTSTNATLLSESRVAELLAADVFDQLILSVDGDRATYEKVRPGCAYEVVEAGVERLLAAKRQRGARRPAIELQILLMDQTEAEIEDFCARWVPLLGSRDRILIKEVDTFGGQVDDRRTAAHRHLEPAERFACRQLWKDLAVSWDGRVTVCCKDVLYKLAVGNVNETPLAELWRSARWETIRRLHLEKRWDELDPCRDCLEWWI
ncbi:MAG: radical SAM protein [Myxococcales bacterium]|nr:radical SAM protein [Myxococcales bacterium]